MTLLELTLLGIVMEDECHAYNIEKIIERRGIRERLNIGFSTIYATLKKMENNFLLESRHITQRKLPGRRIFSITSMGKRLFTEEMMKSLSQPRRTESPFEIALCFAHLLNKNDLRESLSLYDAELGRLIKAKVREIINCDAADTIERGLLTRPLTLLQSERKWLREFMVLL